MGLCFQQHTVCNGGLKKLIKTLKLTKYIRYLQMKQQRFLQEVRAYIPSYLTGERKPHADVNATGVFIGLKPIHTRGHMTRAILEGVSYGLRDSLEIVKDMQIPINEIRITGGALEMSFGLKF